MMTSANYGDSYDSYDETSMTAPSVKLKDRLYAGSRLSDGVSEEFDYNS